MTTQGDREDVSVPTVDPSGKAVEPWQVVVLDGLIRLYFKSPVPKCVVCSSPKSLGDLKANLSLGARRNTHPPVADCYFCCPVTVNRHKKKKFCDGELF